MPSFYLNYTIYFGLLIFYCQIVTILIISNYTKTNNTHTKLKFYFYSAFYITLTSLNLKHSVTNHCNYELPFKSSASISTPCPFYHEREIYNLSGNQKNILSSYFY